MCFITIITGFARVGDAITTTRPFTAHTAGVGLVIGIVFTVVTGFDSLVDLSIATAGCDAAD